jgi:hypothetical protein
LAKNGTNAIASIASRATPPLASTSGFLAPRRSASFAPGRNAMAAKRLLIDVSRPTCELLAPYASTKSPR